MIHRFPIPFPDDDMPDVGGFVHRFGWSITEYSHIGTGMISLPRGELTWLRIRIAPPPPMFPTPSAAITVYSGATLVYDDVEGTMGVTLKPEPQDAIPEDARG